MVSSSDAAYTNAQYDAHGNVIQLGTGATLTQFKYDSTDRNTKIIEGTKSTTYTRDVQNRIVQRGVINGTTTTTKYAFTQTGDTPDLLLNSSNAVVEKYIQLPGNVLLTIRPSDPTPTNQQTFSLPNLHGDIFVTTNANGVSTTEHSYDPFGNKTSTTNPTNTANSATFGWVGQHEKTTETNFTLNPTQMGARVYLPGLGRFLQVDPIEGGVENNYVYPPDAVNKEDLSGQFAWFIPFAAVAAVRIAPYVPRALQMASRIVPRAQQLPRIAPYSKMTGINSKLFGKGNSYKGINLYKGALNSSRWLRVGWSWKGTKAAGNFTFRVAVGCKTCKIFNKTVHWHRDVRIWRN